MRKLIYGCRLDNLPLLNLTHRKPVIKFATRKIGSTWLSVPIILIWRNVLPPILNNFQLRFTELSCCTRRQIREAATRKADARSDVIISLSSPKRAGMAWHVATRSTNLFVATLPYLFARHYAIRIRVSNRVTPRDIYAPTSNFEMSRNRYIVRCIAVVEWLLDSRARHTQTYIFLLEDAGGIIVIVILITCWRGVTAIAGMANLKSNSRTPRKFLSEINPPITSAWSFHVKREIKILLSSCACVLSYMWNSNQSCSY